MTSAAPDVAAVAGPSGSIPIAPVRSTRVYPPQPAKALWDRFEFIFTAKHGSRLNVADIELNVMIRECLNRRIDSFEKLRDQVAASQAARDRLQAKVHWQFTTGDARANRHRLYLTL